MCLRMLLLEVNYLQVDTVVVCPIELETPPPRNSSNFKSPQTNIIFTKRKISTIRSALHPPRGHVLVAA